MSSAVVWGGIAAAGAAGAVTRYLVDLAVAAHTRGDFPWGTLLINASGSLILGVLTGLALYHGFPATPKTILGTGFCGGYTTFSTFTFETLRLVEEGESRTAAGYLLGTFVLGAGAAALGLALAAW